MVDYYSDISGEIAKLEPNTGEGRHLVYERTRNSLVDRFASYSSRISKADYDRERSSLEGAIGRIEKELGAEQLTEPSSTPSNNGGDSSAYAILDYGDAQLKKQVDSYGSLRFIETERGGAL